MASHHDLRVHEQRYENANRLIAQQASLASHRALRVKWGAESVDGRTGRCRHRWCVTGLGEHDPESPKRRGAGAKENATENRLVGLAAG